MNYQNNYDRLVAITREENTPIEVETFGDTGIIFRPAGNSIMFTLTTINIVHEFGNVMFERDGIVLDKVNRD